MHLPSTLTTAIISLLPTAALSSHLQILVPASNHIPNPSTLPPTTTASLTTLSASYVAPLSAFNIFDFRNISAGSYLLDVHCPTHIFSGMRVDVHAAGPDASEKVEAWGTFRGHDWSNKGEIMEVRTTDKGAKMFEARALMPKNYYTERVGFSPLSLLKNPMILIAGVSMVLVFGMPYLMDSMDPEVRAEFEERQKSSPVQGLLAGQQPGANPLQNFDPAAWLAGSQTKKPEAGAASEKGVSR